MDILTPTPTPSKLSQLYCCVDAPASFIPKARYALESLLLPLGIAPKWVDLESLPEGGVYYGRSNTDLPAGVTQFRFAEETSAFFERRTPYDVNRIRWIDAEGEKLPILFDGGEDSEGDLIASAFFWLSGWQEYVNRGCDTHGRFTYAASLQAQLDLAYTPVVDGYRELIAKRLELAGISINRRSWGSHQWAFCPTHDIDYLRKWRAGMVYREVVQYFVANRRKVSMTQRFARLGRFIFDFFQPGDVFREAIRRMVDGIQTVDGKATYFFKTGAHGPNDVYYRTSHPILKKIIQRLDTLGFEVGLHPSYHAHDHIGYLKEEKNLLQAICLRRVRSVRQHFLRHDILVTPRMHEITGFRIDSTLGFPDYEGFRRATCHPFQLFDLHQNRSLDVWEMPLCLMDGVLFNRRHMSVDEAVEATRRLIEVCKKYDGVCVALWHNTLWDEMDFPGWGEHFEHSLRLAVEENARIDTLQGALDAYLS